MCGRNPHCQHAVHVLRRPLCEICIVYFTRTAQDAVTGNRTCCCYMHTSLRFQLLHLRKQTSARWHVAPQEYLCFNISERCILALCAQRALLPTFLRPPHSQSPTLHISWPQTRPWSISVLRSAEWGRVFSKMFSSSHTDCASFSNIHRKAIFFLFACQPHCCVTHSGLQGRVPSAQPSLPLYLKSHPTLSM